MMRGLGYVPDEPDVRDENYAVGAGDMPDLVPDAIDLRAEFGAPYDQNGHNSCIEQAIAKAVRVAHVTDGYEDPPDMARMLLWAQVRGEMLIDKNVGSQIRTAFKKMNAEGFCQDKWWPHDTDMGADARFRQKPSRQARRMAYDQREKLGSTVYRRIYDSGDERIERVRGCLANCELVVFGTDVDHDFVHGRFNPAVPLQPPVRNIAGGHAMCIVGYLPGDIFVVGNSWGSHWGNGGFCLFSADYVTSLITRDLWTVYKAPWYSELS